MGDPCSAGAPPSNPPFLAVYGTLGRDYPQNRLLTQTGALFERGCEIRAVLIDLGRFPGLRPGDGRISGELYRLPALYDFSVVDRYEGFDPATPERSLFVRRPVWLAAPQKRAAWVYFLATDPGPDAVARVSGRWRPRRG